MHKIFKLKIFYKILVFFPVIFYFGKRSYIAFDEGFYALQARWILEKGNWTIPLWWDEYVLDRTIGLQFLIAKSQYIFGKNTFSAYLPTTIGAIIMLFTTYKLHEELCDKRFAIVSPLILSTTFLWFDYSHLATQDIIYSSLVTTGIYFLIKVRSNETKLYILFFGIWIGLAFMFKTFLVAVPLISLTPYMFSKKELFSSKFFWMGLLIGFIPFLLWAFYINTFLDKNIIFYLFDKFNILSNKNNFTNPFYYYFWNMPLTFLPWSIFSIIGILSNFSENQRNKNILTFFPLILIFVLSLFSTKTPYYPLQISSVLSLNSFLGIKYLYTSRKYKYIFILFTSKIIPIFLISSLIIYFFWFKNTSYLNNKENTFIFLGIFSLSLCWSFIKNKTSFYKVLIPLILGPYLLTSFLLQSGLFTDRSRELREIMDYVSSLEIVKKEIIKVDKSGMDSSKAFSKIIRIALLTPNLGNSFQNINDLASSELAWSTSSKLENSKNNSYDILYQSPILEPWKLIIKK